MRIDVALGPADIAQLVRRDLSETTCVVFDVLRATSSMVTAFAHGAVEVRPVRTLDEAIECRAANPGVLLGGERLGEKPDGFDFGNSPFDYRDVRGARIAWTTTNGTIALRACEHAARVLVGALLNLDAVAEQLRREARLLVVCAGTFEDPALEDVFAAGLLVEKFPGATLADSARMALAVGQGFTGPLEALRLSRNGQALARAGRDAEVEWCARCSAYNVVPFMDGSIIRPIP